MPYVDHREMCRFENRFKPGYKLVVELLGRIKGELLRQVQAAKMDASCAIPQNDTASSSQDPPATVQDLGKLSMSVPCLPIFHLQSPDDSDSASLDNPQGLQNSLNRSTGSISDSDFQERVAAAPTPPESPIQPDDLPLDQKASVPSFQLEPNSPPDSSPAVGISSSSPQITLHLSNVSLNSSNIDEPSYRSQASTLIDSSPAPKTNQPRASRRTSAPSSCPTPQVEDSQDLESTWPPISFLFIVKGLSLNDDPNTGGIAPRVNEDGRFLPPVYSAGFDQITPGTVFRYKNGIISTTQRYIWRDGSVFADWTPEPLQVHKAVTMFYCDVFQQFLVADGDATTRDIANADFPGDRWYPLNFHHVGEVSQVDLVGPDPYLVPGLGGFIGGLGLASYQHPDSEDAPPSGGLAGHLAIVIGLIAFSCRRRDLDRILVEDHAWWNRQWIGHTRHHGRRPQRGLIVTVCYDPENTDNGSNTRTLEELEWGGQPLIS